VRTSCFLEESLSLLNLIWANFTVQGVELANLGVLEIEEVSVKMLRGQIARPYLRSGLVPGFFAFISVEMRAKKGKIKEPGGRRRSPRILGPRSDQHQAS